jgi:branched-chain amino acid transport system ATP-binding protein
VTQVELLEAKGLFVSYGPIDVLKGVSLQVREGATLAIIGPNGAGKTTLFKALTGEILCRTGSIRFRGQDVTRVRAHERTRQGMGRTFQTSRIFPDFTAAENVITAIESRERGAGHPQGPWWQWRIDSAIRDEAQGLLGMLGIGALGRRIAGSLSHGDKKRLELAVALALEPRILMLDEPTAGMAPSDRRKIVELILKIRAEKKLSLLITEHDMDVIFNLANSVLVMNYGEVIAHGSVDAVRRDPVVRQVYLGQEMHSAAG